MFRALLWEFLSAVRSMSVWTRRRYWVREGSYGFVVERRYMSAVALDRVWEVQGACEEVGLDI